MGSRVERRKSRGGRCSAGLIVPCGPCARMMSSNCGFTIGCDPARFGVLDRSFVPQRKWAKSRCFSISHHSAAIRDKTGKACLCWEQWARGAFLLNGSQDCSRVHKSVVSIELGRTELVHAKERWLSIDCCLAVCVPQVVQRPPCLPVSAHPECRYPLSKECCEEG